MIDHHIIARDNYAYIEIKQTPDLDTFIRASRLFIADPGYSANLHRICDFSQAELSHVTRAELNDYVKFALENITLGPTTRVALVAPSPSKAGIFQSFAEHVESGSFRIFFQPEEAVNWIKAAPPVRTAEEQKGPDDRPSSS